MDAEKQKYTPKKTGRKPKDDPAVYRYGIKLTSQENVIFEKLLDESGIKEKAKFIKAAIFDKEIKVVKVDKTTKDYFMRLTNIYSQFRSIGNNYNQTVRAIKANFGDKRAAALLYKLERETMKLAYLSAQILSLTEEYETKYLRK